MARRRRPSTNFYIPGRPQYSPPLANLRLDPRRVAAISQAALTARTLNVHKRNQRQLLDRAKRGPRSATRSVDRTGSLPARSMLQALICNKRKERKEVLFANRKAGGGGISRKRHRTILSTIFC